MNELKTFFKNTVPELVVNRTLVDRLVSFQVYFSTKNKDHAEFFGGTLTGVNNVKFTTQDMDRFFAEVLEVPESNIEEGLVRLNCIKADRKVSSNHFNNTCMYLIHLFLASNLKEREVGARAVAMVLLYRFITSLLYNGFKFLADKDKALAAYNALSNKFVLKKQGSWNNYLNYRTEDLISKSGLHYKTLLDYTNDDKILYAITDSQGRIRDTFKNIYSTYVEIVKNGSNYSSTSNTFEFEGETVLRDKSKGLEGYTEYLKSTLSDKGSFIKSELVDAVSDIMKTSSASSITDVLEWVSENYHYSRLHLPAYIDEVMTHAFRYMEDNRTTVSRLNNLINLALLLKGVYMSSRSSDSQLLEMRKHGETIVKTATGLKNASTLSSLRTSLMLYFVLRSLVRLP